MYFNEEVILFMVNLNYKVMDRRMEIYYILINFFVVFFLFEISFEW